MTHKVLIRLSAGYPLVKDRLHTCYAPVRRSPTEYCYSSLPLDLHVLGLSLAFILSQDQTLRCKFVYFVSQFRMTSLLSTGIFQGTLLCSHIAPFVLCTFVLFSCTTSFCYFNLSKITLKIALDSGLSFLVAKSAAKLQQVSDMTKFFRNFFQ